MSGILASSELVPNAYRNKPNDIIIAYEYGSALGLSWMQALRSVSVINGQASLWGDAVPALIYGSGDCERFHETYDGPTLAVKDGKEVFEDAYTAVCVMKRKGMPDEVVRRFSVADAKTAGLWMKKGRQGGDTPWVTYPKRMLQMRARGFCARDTFPDKLAGLILAEEAMDYPEAIDATVISSEPVGSNPALDVLGKLPEALRDHIEKAFETLSLASGLRLVKLNEFLLATEGTDEEKAERLLRWCRDEYALRKTGQKPVAKKPENGKSVSPTTVAGGGSTGSAASLGTVASPVAADVPAPASPPAPDKSVQAGEVNWGGEKLADSVGF